MSSGASGGRDLATRPPTSEDAILIRHEEEVGEVRKRWRGVGYLRARKRVEKLKVNEAFERDVEDVRLERLPVSASDSGRIETLDDGSLSIPVYEEELVVTKRVVLKERVVIRKAVVTETQRVRVDLLREQVEVETDESVADRVTVD
jgi:uncharacterized protein (TIGR02271 family)